MQSTYFLETARVIESSRVAKETFVTKFHSPLISSSISPGQFVMASFAGTIEPFLPRAFSVCDAADDWLSILYVRIGAGTTKLSALEPGAAITLNGPLGKGFPRPKRGEEDWCIVGGSGAAIIPFLAREFEAAGATLFVIYGARKSDQIVDFQHKNTMVSTDDGSAGYHGTAVDLAINKMKERKPQKVFACGPTPMLKSVQREIGPRVPTFLSVETPMACGNGLCQGCPVKRKGTNEYYLACKDGPVFESGEIDFSEGSES